MSRLSREQIAPEVFTFLEDHLGGVIVEFENQAGGYSNGAAAKVTAANDARAFVKIAQKASGGRTFELYQREVQVLGGLPAGIPVPRLRSSYESEGWIVLVIDLIEGANPQSISDLYAVLDAVEQLPQVEEGLFPAVEEGYGFLESSWSRVPSGSHLLSEWAETNRVRLESVASRAVEAIDGSYLVHADLRPDNVLIDSGGRAWLVDWPYAVRGSRWFDPLLFLFDATNTLPELDIQTIIDAHPLFADMAQEDADAVQSGYAAYCIVAAAQPLDGVSQELRDFQAKNARGLLALLEKRWSRSSKA